MIFHFRFFSALLSLRQPLACFQFYFIFIAIPEELFFWTRMHWILIHSFRLVHSIGTPFSIRTSEVTTERSHASLGQFVAR